MTNGVPVQRGEDRGERPSTTGSEPNLVVAARAQSKACGMLLSLVALITR
jgi:hypothetical protein